MKLYVENQADPAMRLVSEMIIYLMKEHIFDFPRFNKLDTIIKISS